MKKAKVVNQVNKQNRTLATKRAVWLTIGAVAVLGTVSVVVPTSNIPGFGYIAEILGIEADSTRNLTMSDFAAYAVGARDNKIAALREANSLTYGGSGNADSGLSPFSTFTKDRLSQAYMENSKEADSMEKSLSGTITPFDKNALDREITLDKDLLAQGFNPGKISANSQAAQAGAMEALAAAAGQQSEALGKPANQKELQGIASLVGVKDSNISNIVGTGNILSLANKDEMLYERIQQQARALAGTSIFGSLNPEFSRADTRIGRPVFGLFKELGNSYFFSRYAKGAKYSTAASDIAVAAFDGGSPQDQSILTRDETAKAGAAGNPQENLNQNAANINACQHMRDVYKQALSSYYSSIETLKDTLKQIANNNPKVPGSCYGLNSNRTVKQQRETWNEQIPAIKDLCENIRAQRNQFNNQCGIVIEQPVLSCSELVENLKLAGLPVAGMMYRKCKNMAIFAKGSIDVSRRDRRKLRKWIRKFNGYKSPADCEENCCDDECAADKADNDVPIDEDDIEGAERVCMSETRCYEGYFDEQIEAAFAFGNITNITKLPKK